MKSTKGLSDIVATLIIILLTLVAVGIIWVVIRNVVTSGSQQVSISSQCLSVSLQAVSVNESSPGVYNVTLMRNAGGNTTIGGIKVSIFSSVNNSGVIDFGKALTPLQTYMSVLNTSVAPATVVIGGSSIQFTPYFIDSSGNQQLCSQTQTFTFH